MKLYRKTKADWQEFFRFCSACTNSLAVAGTLVITLVSIVTAQADPSSPSIGTAESNPGVFKAWPGSPQAHPPQPAPSRESYYLDTGDQIHLRFYDRYDRNDLNGEYIIGQDGELRIPRIGLYNARNKTVAELGHDIGLAAEKKGEKLGYFSIDVSRCRPFYVAGLVNNPGSYAFVPGLMVVQAVSLAGGLYHVPQTSIAEALQHTTDAAREKITLTDTLTRISALVARRARLEAEQKGASTILMPKELLRLEPLRAEEIVVAEQSVLERSRQAFNREKSGLESLVTLKRREVENYEQEIIRLKERIEEQSKISGELKRLHEDRVINQQRFFEAVVTLDGLQRDRQSSVGGLSQANTALEKAQRDLAALTLAENARISRELNDTELELARLSRFAEQTRELATGLEALSGRITHRAVATYQIIRRNADGQLSEMQANETTPIMPGDVIKVDLRMEPEPFFSN